WLPRCVDPRSVASGRCSEILHQLRRSVAVVRVANDPRLDGWERRVGRTQERVGDGYDALLERLDDLLSIESVNQRAAEPQVQQGHRIGIHELRPGREPVL